MGDHARAPTRPKAAKPHTCVACDYPIAVGEVHVHQTGYWDGYAFRNRFHVECWNELTEAGEFEFCPGDIDPPARLRSLTP